MNLKQLQTWHPPAMQCHLTSLSPSLHTLLLSTLNHQPSEAMFLYRKSQLFSDEIRSYFVVLFVVIFIFWERANCPWLGCHNCILESTITYLVKVECVHIDGSRPLPQDLSVQSKRHATDKLAGLCMQMYQNRISRLYL